MRALFFGIVVLYLFEVFCVIMVVVGGSAVMQMDTANDNGHAAASVYNKHATG